ncbi:ABC transporter permease [Clostridium sporogenes]|uniref:ABC transporter permease n=1 Tax=Clostridium sporogenes TaxID=1509 RepID=A0AAE4JU51_CLOSG|nr:ABC transporter permease [Clostridium sporogenes]MDS1005230.1 ABC transporter permease [Clostridium sporogenes]
MNFNMLIRSAILCLKANKMRVFLTMIGIIIGISTEVVILSIGAGLKNNVSKSVNTTDVNSLSITFESKGVNTGDSAQPFDKSDFNQLKNIDGVANIGADNDGIMGFLNLGGQATYFDKSTYLMFKEYKNQSINIIAGRSIAENDNESKEPVILITEKHAKELFGNNYEEGLGKAIKLNGVYLEVIGIIKDPLPTSLEGGSDYIPSFLKESFKSENEIMSVKVKVKEGYKLDDVFKDIKDELERLHPDINGEYVKADPQAMIKAFQSIISGITGFIAVVSGISLFVSGVGVMNIMYVSVTERKKEIGIRRAIGAKSKIILSQFLIESILITLLGGILGIIIGYGLSKIVGLLCPLKPIFTFKIFIGSSITSILIGIIFGIIPASKASRLDPIKAIYK